MLCAKCGSELNTAVCTCCGYDHTLEEVLYLMQPARRLSMKWEPKEELYDPAAFHIEDGVLIKYLGSSAFVDVPEGVIAIGDEAFAGNETVYRVDLPLSLQRIGRASFEGCTRLESIEICENVTRLGENAFGRCESLTSVALPAGVTVIPDLAFSGCTGLRYVLMSEQVKVIGAAAFFGCTELTAVYAETLERIESSAFACCTALTSIRFPNLIYVGSGAFNACSELSWVTLGNALRYLGDFAFDGCRKLRSVELGELPELYVGRDVFQDCRQLIPVHYMKPEVDGQSQMTVIHPSYFVVEEPADRTVDGFVIRSGVLLEVPDLPTVRIPEGVTHIAMGAFADRENVAAVTIPGTVESIDSYTFLRCERLLMVTMEQGFRRIAMGAFQECPQLARLTVPDTLEYVSVFPHMEGFSSIVVMASDEWKQAHPDFCEYLSNPLHKEEETV